MSKQDDGGPAYPTGIARDMPATMHGMTLLDWYAGQALIGLLMKGPFDYDDGLAEVAYSYAADMVAEKRRRERD